MEGYSVGIKGGILKINDARLKEDLERVAGGDDIRIQQQDVPLDWHEQQAKQAQAALTAVKPPAPSPQPTEEEGAANDNAERVRRSFRASHERSLAL
jgi:hypothetical protein